MFRRRRLVQAGGFPYVDDKNIPAKCRSGQSPFDLQVEEQT